MEYLIIIALQLCGISLHIMQKIITIGAAHEDHSWKQVFGAFFKEDWDTLIVSGIVLCVNLLLQFIINNYAMDIIYQNPNFHLWMFGAAFVIGYAGQRLVYKYLGSAEKFLDKKVGDKLV